MKYFKIIAIPLVALLTNCTTFSTSIETKRDIDITAMRKGEACSTYLFGFKLPYIGNFDIKISGNNSASEAIKSGGISKPFVVDKTVKRYGLYNIKCTTIYGNK